MSSTVTKRRPGASRVESIGIPGRRSSLCASPGAGAVANEDCWYEVEIRWKPVLRATVVDLGGTEPVYTSRCTTNGTYQMNIGFLIPSDSSAVNYEEVNVDGKKCASLCEAETEAAIAALKRVAILLKNMKVVDVSQLRYEEAKIKSRAQLVEAEELHLILDMLLSDWADCTREIEDAYDPLLSKIANGTDVKSKKIRVDVANRLLEITKVYQKMQIDLSTESKAVKAEWWKTHALMRQCFKEPLVPRVDDYEVDIPCAIKIKMTVVLAEMMVSLGWEDPAFTITWRARNRKCMCEVELQPKGLYIFRTMGRITIESGEETSEEEAKESGAKAEILFMELKMSIFLVDVNYSKRTQVESHLMKTEHVVQLVSSLVSNARAEWDQELDNLSICDDRCHNMLGKHVFKDENDEEYSVKQECAEAVTAAYESCLSRFRRGRRRTLDVGPSKKKRKRKE